MDTIEDLDAILEEEISSRDIQNRYDPVLVFLAANGGSKSFMYSEFTAKVRKILAKGNLSEEDLRIAIDVAIENPEREIPLPENEELRNLIETYTKNLDEMAYQLQKRVSMFLDQGDASALSTFAYNSLDVPGSSKLPNEMLTSVMSTMSGTGPLSTNTCNHQ